MCKFVRYIGFLIIFCCIDKIFSQVAIGTTTLQPDAMLQLESNDKGLLIPNVALTSRDDVITVLPSSVEGLMVYNTANTGTGKLIVSPGFYYWDGDLWVKLYSEGYTDQAIQTVVKREDDSDTIDEYTLVNKTITAPYSGTYQIHASAYYACVGADNNNFDAVGYSEIILEIDNSKVKSGFVTSSAKRTSVGGFVALAQQTSFVYQVDLVEGQNYNFKIVGREWLAVNMDRDGLDSFVAGSSGIWGTPTRDYAGNIEDDNDGQRAVLTITLLRQF